MEKNIKAYEKGFLDGYKEHQKFINDEFNKFTKNVLPKKVKPLPMICWSCLTTEHKSLLCNPKCNHK